MQSASSDMLRVIPTIDEQELWRMDGATSMSSWLAARYGVAWATALEWVRVANALRSLPVIAGAYAEGRLSFDQLKALTRFVTAETDQLWSERANETSLSGLWAEARRHERVSRQQAEHDRRMRRLWMQWDEDRRFLSLGGELPAEQGAAVEAALERRAQEVVLEDGPLYDRHGARLADALVELVCSGEGGGTAPVLVVHSDASVLTAVCDRGEPRIAETDSGVPLAEESIRRLACDSGLEWVVEQDGRSIGIGRRSRRVPSWLMRQLHHRDRHCRFRGCERRRWLKAHHIEHWTHGGPTNADNLILLCQSHHRLVHEGGWSARGDPAHGLRFHGPTGRPLERFTTARSRAA